jgi:hypothetical protein
MVNTTITAQTGTDRSGLQSERHGQSSLTYSFLEHDLLLGKEVLPLSPLRNDILGSQQRVAVGGDALGINLLLQARELAEVGTVSSNAAETCLDVGQLRLEIVLALGDRVFLLGDPARKRIGNIGEALAQSIVLLLTRKLGIVGNLAGSESLAKNSTSLGKALLTQQEHTNVSQSIVLSLSLSPLCFHSPTADL